MIRIRPLARLIEEVDPNRDYIWTIVDEDGQLCLNVTKIKYRENGLDEIIKTVRTAYSSGLVSASKKKLKDIIEELEK